MHKGQGASADSSVAHLVEVFDKMHPDGYSQSIVPYSGFIQFAKIPMNATVLEVGVGAGETVPHVLEVTENATFGDYSAQAVQKVSDKYNVKALVMDGCDLPFDDNSFEVYLSNYVVHNIPGEASRRQFFAEAVRVVKPGGSCVFGMLPNKSAWLLQLKNYLSAYSRNIMLGRDDYFKVFSRREIEQLFSQLGLSSLLFRDSKEANSSSPSGRIGYRSEYFDVKATKKLPE